MRAVHSTVTQLASQHSSLTFEAVTRKVNRYRGPWCINPTAVYCLAI